MIEEKFRSFGLDDIDDYFDDEELVLPKMPVEKRFVVKFKLKKDFKLPPLELDDEDE
jgi:hypothetical protein